MRVRREKASRTCSAIAVCASRSACVTVDRGSGFTTSGCDRSIPSPRSRTVYVPGTAKGPRVGSPQSIFAPGMTSAPACARSHTARRTPAPFEKSPSGFSSGSKSSTPFHGLASLDSVRITVPRASTISMVSGVVTSSFSQ